MFQETKTCKNLCSYNSPRISSEVLDCALPFTFDQYAICSWQCQYCFAFYSKSNNPTLRHTVINGKANSVNIKKIEKLFKGESNCKDHKVFYEYFIKNKVPMQWGGLGEPFDDFERKQRVGLELIKFFDEIRYPIIFSTKGTLPAEDEYFDIFKKHPENWMFRYSLISLDEEKCKQIEVGVPSPWERLKAMKKLSDAGIYTILRFRPYMLGLSEKTDLALLEEAKKTGAKAVSLEFWCVEVRANKFIKQRYHNISKILGYDISKFYKVGSEHKGGYLRLTRSVKWKYVKRILAACRRLGLGFYVSDPAFKELSDGGCCCGIPPQHPVFGNYLKAQFTEMIVEARRKALKDGFAEITFDDLANKGIGLEWAKHIKVAGYIPTTSIERHARWLYKHMTFYDRFIEKWNDPNKFESPYRLFEGKLKPVRLDEKKNLVYQYVLTPEDFEAEEINIGVKAVG